MKPRYYLIQLTPDGPLTPFVVWSLQPFHLAMIHELLDHDHSPGQRLGTWVRHRTEAHREEFAVGSLTYEGLLFAYACISVWRIPWYHPARLAQLWLMAPLWVELQLRVFVGEPAKELL